MVLYEVYYPQDPSFRFNPDLKRSDVLVGRVPAKGWRLAVSLDAKDLEDLYRILNVGGFGRFVRSMSVGDVAFDPSSDRLWQVDDVGFEAL